MPQFSTSLFESFIIETTNPFSGLSSGSDTLSSISSPGSPAATSSPVQRKQLDGNKNTRKRMKILNINFQSVKNKKEEICNLIDSSTPDVIIGTETWLNDGIHNSEIFPPNYDVIRKDRKDGYGGVLIAISRDYSYEQLPMNTECETVFIKLKVNGNQELIIGSAYRPPSSSIQYTEDMCSLFANLEKSHKKAVVWIGGDFNLPDIDWTSHTIKGNQNPTALNRHFLDYLDGSGMQQIVNFSTRNNSTLDLFLSNRPSLINRCTSLPGISDHDIVFVESDATPRRIKPVRRKIYLWKHASSLDMKEECIGFQNEFIYKHSSSSDVAGMWDDIKSFLLNVLEKHVPSKMTSTRFNQPWITSSVKRLTRKKKRSYLRARRSRKEKDFHKYRSLKKQCRVACKEAYNDYVTNIISPDATHNPKRFWSFINSKRSDTTGVSPLKGQDGITYSDSQKKADILNDQFASVFNHDEDPSCIVDKGPSPYPAMKKIVVSESGVCKLLSNLQIHKATGPDDIPARLLKDLAAELSPVFTLFFQTSLDQGEVPDDWKKANVVPIYKKGERNHPGNYRPISLTSISCKMLEHIVCSSIMDHLDSHNVLHDAQHGFRKKRSCETQLILAVQDLAKGIDAREQHDVILLDFTKAFDKVPHRRLLYKLQFYGIQGLLNNWIATFLQDRTQQVILEGASSKIADVTSGVPQGSVLGPLMFLLYINDLPEYLTSDTKVRLFADDCMLYRKITSEQDSAALQQDLNALQQWEQDWLMKFNPPKCQVISVTKKQKLITKAYYLHGQTLSRADTAKYLGVHLTKNLSWNHHVDALCKKANSTSAFLRRNINACPRKTKILCYTTLLRPILEYACTVWDPSTQENITKLEKVQRRFARFVLNDYRWTSSVTPMIHKMHWQILQERRAQLKVAMMFRIMNSLVDIPRTYTVLAPSPYLHRGHALKLVVPHARTSCYQTSFFPDATRLWNSLPLDAVNCTSLDVFKKRVQDIQLR